MTSSSIVRAASILFLSALDSCTLKFLVLSAENSVQINIFTNAFTSSATSCRNGNSCFASQNERMTSSQITSALHVSSIEKTDYFSATDMQLPEHHVIEIQTTRSRPKKSKPSKVRSRATSTKRAGLPLSVTVSNSTLSVQSDLYGLQPKNSNRHGMLKSDEERKKNRKKTFKVSSTQTSRTAGVRKGLLSKHRGLLSREDEAKYTYAIRSLRKAIKIRDQLSFARKSESIDLDSTKTSQDITEAEWAKACDLSVIDLRRVMLSGQDARTQLVSKNAGLVMQIAKRYHSRSPDHSILTLQDMVQEGNLGLMEAAERFDPKRGFKFGTYAAWWVRQRILRSIADHSRVIRLPVHVHTMLNTIEKTRKEMTSVIGRSPSTPELAHELGIPVSKIQLYTDSSRSVLSLEGPVNQSKSGKNMVEDTRTISDRIASDNPSPEDNAEVDFLRQDIRAVINELNSIERDVLIHRFGLDDGTFKTVSEVAEILDISRERTRLVEARALNKLRHPGRNYKLKEYVEDNGGNNGSMSNPIGLGIGSKNFPPKNPDKDIPTSNGHITPEQLWSI